jgi:hypothetical protein
VRATRSTYTGLPGTAPHSRCQPSSTFCHGCLVQTHPSPRPWMVGQRAGLAAIGGPTSTPRDTPQAAGTQPQQSVTAAGRCICDQQPADQVHCGAHSSAREAAKQPYMSPVSNSPSSRKCSGVYASPQHQQLCHEAHGSTQRHIHTHNPAAGMQQVQTHEDIRCPVWCPSAPLLLARVQTHNPCHTHAHTKASTRCSVAMPNPRTCVGDAGGGVSGVWSPCQVSYADLNMSLRAVIGSGTPTGTSVMLLLSLAGGSQVAAGPGAACPV